MPSNGTPQSWRDRAAAQPNRVVRPPLDPDPLTVTPEDEERGHDWAALLLAFLVIGGLTLLALYAPTIIRGLAGR